MTLSWRYKSIINVCLIHLGTVGGRGPPRGQFNKPAMKPENSSPCCNFGESRFMQSTRSMYFLTVVMAVAFQISPVSTKMSELSLIHQEQFGIPLVFLG